jgi:hypothetical protein
VKEETMGLQLDKPARRSTSQLNPKNGRYFVAQIVGCPADRYRDVRRNLAEKAGIAAPYHLEDAKAKRSAGWRPRRDVDFAFIMSDFIGHTGALVARRALRAAGIPAFLADSRWVRLRFAIWRYHLARFELPPRVKAQLTGDALETIPELAPAPLAVEIDAPPVVPALPIAPPPPLAIAPPPAESSPADSSDVAILSSHDAQLVLIFAQEIRERLAKVGMRAVMITPEGLEFQYSSKAPANASATPERVAPIVDAPKAEEPSAAAPETIPAPSNASEVTL